MSETNLNYQHNVMGYIANAFKLYTTNFLPLIALQAIILVIPYSLGQVGLNIQETGLLFFGVRLTEVLIAVAVIRIYLTGNFSLVALLKNLNLKFVAGSFLIGFFQLWIFVMVSLSFINMISNPKVISAIFFAVLFVLSYFLVFCQTCYIMPAISPINTSIQLVKAHFSVVFKVISLSMMLYFLFVYFLLELNLKQYPIPLEGANFADYFGSLIKNPEFISSLKNTQYLSLMLFHPFQCVILIVLYLDVARTNGLLKFEDLIQFNNRFYNENLTATQNPNDLKEEISISNDDGLDAKEQSSDTPSNSSDVKNNSNNTIDDDPFENAPVNTIRPKIAPNENDYTKPPDNFGEDNIGGNKDKDKDNEDLDEDDKNKPLN